jgi:hypothetical protein
MLEFKCWGNVENREGKGQLELRRLNSSHEHAGRSTNNHGRISVIEKKI